MGVPYQRAGQLVAAGKPLRRARAS
jgi:hypothetical protein